MMGAESVAYHRETIIERADDHPEATRSYYSSRGETPLSWGGSGATALGLEGPVSDAAYDALYGLGGAIDPTSGVRLVHTRRPGMELVIGAEKTVAELGVIGRTDDMHAIMDAERDATLSYLDELTLRRGGRRGEKAIPSATAGLVYATTRHATSRAGDPSPHDHVLLANVIAMRDEKGGYKAPDTVLWREHLHAATMVGRLAAAHEAVKWGYGIEPYSGPSGRLRHWRISGIPEAVTALHSKRAHEIDAAVAEAGHGTYRARAVAARTTRSAKRHVPTDDLVRTWRVELEAAGFPVSQLVASVDEASRVRPIRIDRIPAWDLDELAAQVLGQDGALSARKVFSRRDVIVALAPSLYGRAPDQLDRVVDAVLAHRDAIPLLGVARATEQPYVTAAVLAAEIAVARLVASEAERTDAAVVPGDFVGHAIEETEAALGHRLSAGQRAAVEGICTSGRGAELVVGLAGAGKTTVMAVVRGAFESAGYEVVGTAVSGQAARTLRQEAGIDQSRTVASLRWRLEHQRLELSHRHVVVLDEAGMADDRDVAMVFTASSLAGAKVVMVGDDRQLGAIDPGGAHGALIERHGSVVHVLDENLRQRDAGEASALAELRAGHVAAAVDWYATHDRVVIAPSRDELLDALVDRWATDALASKDTALLAWRRANVAELNARARERWAEAGRLSGPELPAPGGARYAAGDRIVTLSPGAGGRVVTSERGVVTSVDVESGALVATMDDGRVERFGRENIGADRLAHGYAMTVHRTQGATVDVAHAYADGGGRELAYVAMSRATDRTTVYVVADDLEVARDDLCRDWAHERRWTWAIDTGTPGTAPQGDRARDLVLARAALVRERDALRALIPPDARAEREALERQIDHLESRLGSLRAGRSQDPDVQELDRAWARAQRDRAEAERRGEDRSLSRRERRRWSERAETLRAPEVEARQQLEDARERAFLAHAPQLKESLVRLEARQNELHARLLERVDWLERHPELEPRIDHLDAEISGLNRALELSGLGMAPEIASLDVDIGFGPEL